MTAKEKMHSGALYLPMDEELFQEQMRCLDRLYDFNQTRPSELDRRAALLRELFAEIGEDCYIEPPLHTNWGGRHVHFGRNVYANFNLTLVDDTHIYIGDYTMLGPNVVIATAGHPLLPELREQGYARIGDVKYAVLENSGQLSILPWARTQPPSAGQLGLEAEDDVTLPVVLINDGRVLDKNLSACGRDRAWLRKTLEAKGFRSPKEVFLLTLDERGTVLCVGKELDA